jgi:hypothetical protein
MPQNTAEQKKKIKTKKGDANNLKGYRGRGRKEWG